MKTRSFAIIVFVAILIIFVILFIAVLIFQKYKFDAYKKKLLHVKDWDDNYRASVAALNEDIQLNYEDQPPIV